MPGQTWREVVSEDRDRDHGCNSPFPASELLREWLKYSFGVFEEVGGFPGDSIYKEEYRFGSETVTSQGCSGDVSWSSEMFCPAQTSLNTLAPTKQNLLCRGQTARQVIFSSPSMSRQNSVDWRESDWAPPRLLYLLPAANHYNLLLDLSQPLQDQWLPVRKSLFRFIQSIPAGSTVSIVSQDLEPRLALPPTLVTQSNREEISSRIPRRVPSRKTTCLKCGLDTALDAMKDYKVESSDWNWTVCNDLHFAGISQVWDIDSDHRTPARLSCPWHCAGPGQPK